MNIGNLKSNDDGVIIGRITTMAFSAVVALREVNSSNERAPSHDIMGLSADQRNWVKVGAVWQYASNETGEEFLSGRIDDPSLEKPLDLAMFRQEDGSYNVAWRRPQAKRSVPKAQTDESGLPPMPPAGDSSSADTGTGPVNDGGDGLGESTAPAPKAKTPAKGKQKETADA